MQARRAKVNPNFKGIPKFNINTVKRLIEYVMKTYKIRFILVLIFILISATASVSGALFLKILIDEYIAPLLGSENPVFTKLLQAIGVMAFVYISGIIATYAYNRQMIIIGQGVQKSIRNNLFQKMQKLPINYFDTNSFGNIMSCYTNDIDTLRQMISQSIPMMFSAIISVSLMFCSMIYTSIYLTILVIVMIFFIFKLSRQIAKRSGTYFFKQQENLGNLNGYIEEMINGQKVIKVFCYEDETIKKFNTKSHALFDSSFNANKYANIMMPVMGNLSNLSYILVAILGGYLALSGISNLTLGAIASFLQLTKSFNRPINQMSQQLNSVIMAMAGAERIFNLMDQVPEEDNGNVTLVNAICDHNNNLIETSKRTGTWAWKIPNNDGTFSYIKVIGDIIFENVDFSYDGTRMILHNVSFTANPGEKIAFVGATGAGKTTIISLINRFYDVTNGRILYDGIDINQIKKSDLRHSIGMVLQDTHLFTGSVMDNIRYGKLDATDDEIIAAAKLTGAHSFISRLPDGYDTYLESDGSTLSQGQRQLLSIARAAIADPPVMILDEATASIDTRTEKLVQDGMDALMKERTVLIIAHRLSTIQNSDKIVVLDKGIIIEEGNHNQLIEKKGHYYQLYTGSFETADEMENKEL